MVFEHDGKTYALDFPRRDVPRTLTAGEKAKLAPDDPPPTRRETTARLALKDGNGKFTEVMRATVRKHSTDPQKSNDEVRKIALDRLFPYVAPELVNPIKAAYYGRFRGKR